MKIAVITNNIPHRSAHSIYIMKMTQGFFKLGHDVEVLIVCRVIEDSNRLKIKNLNDFYGITKEIKFKYFRDYSLNYFLGIRFIGAFLNKITRSLSCFFPHLMSIFNTERKISNYCKNNNINYAYCSNVFRVVFYNILNKIPTTIENHNYYENEIPLDLKLVFKLSERKCFKGIITMNEFLKRPFIKRGVPKEKVFALSNVVEFDKFNKITNDKEKIRRKLNLPLNKKILLYSGVVGESRGTKTIIDAANILNIQELSFLFIGGKEKDIKKWKKYKRKKGINADISFLGFKENRQIPFYIKSADILLAPYSLKCSTVQFMSPMKLYEYMASKIPIIASNAKRLKEICNNNECFFFQIDDPRDLSKKIKFLLNNKELQNEIVQNAYKKVKNLTYKNRCKKILELIK